MKKVILVLAAAALFMVSCAEHHCPTYNDAGPKHHHKPSSVHGNKG